MASSDRYWQANWSKKLSYTNSTPLETPSAPNVEIKGNVLTATLEGIDITGADSIVFEVVKDNQTTFASSKSVTIVTGYVSYSCTVTLGHEYKVRCKAQNVKKEESDWSAYSSNAATVPSVPENLTAKATSETAIRVEWSEVSTAETYEIEYATEVKHFEETATATSVTGIELTYREIELTSGTQYYFRIRAVNEAGESEWSEISDPIIIGEEPSAPTTWSSTTTAIVGEPLILYWVHNSVDGSSQTYAQLELTIDGVTQDAITIKNSEDEDEKDKTSYYEFDTSGYTEGTVIQWRVRTAGVVSDGYGDWSTMREVNVYAQPTLEFKMVDSGGNAINALTDTPLTGFPFYASAVAGPNTQAPLGYHLSIVSAQVYQTVDNLGNARIVNEGESVYSKFFDTVNELMVELSPGNLDLENSMNYIATCTVSMDSGLTAESSITFTVAWDEIFCEPNAEIGIDEDSLTATVRPYCTDNQIMYYEVTNSSGIYTKTSTSLGYVYGSIVKGATTTTGEKVYLGTDADGDDIYYCKVIESTPVTDVYFAVYRREYDGTFTRLIDEDIDGELNVAFTDPHPALDYARYRVVATSKTTGAVSYYDLPGYPVGCKAIVIQWNEEWTNFETAEDEVPEQPAWAGSMLKLIYDVDVSEAPSPDVSFVEYVGRKHPVSYYGTQIGETASWSTSVPKSDKETIYALRRLAKWMGDVYVREPSGVGYWANITVNFNQKHGDLVVPVSFSIKRVEGGV